MNKIQTQMEKLAIMDMDFLRLEDVRDNDLYQLLYGAFYYTTIPTQFNLVAYLLSSYNDPVLRELLLDNWMKVVRSSRSALNDLNALSNSPLQVDFLSRRKSPVGISSVSASKLLDSYGQLIGVMERMKESAGADFILHGTEWKPVFFSFDQSYAYAIQHCDSLNTDSRWAKKAQEVLGQLYDEGRLEDFDLLKERFEEEGSNNVYRKIILDEAINRGVDYKTLEPFYDPDEEIVESDYQLFRALCIRCYFGKELDLTPTL